MGEDIKTKPRGKKKHLPRLEIKPAPVIALSRLALWNELDQQR